MIEDAINELLYADGDIDIDAIDNLCKPNKKKFPSF